MSGNVREWCNDWYAPDYYTQSPDTDPRGPAAGDKAVLRGGDFFHHRRQLHQLGALLRRAGLCRRLRRVRRLRLPLCEIGEAGRNARGIEIGVLEGWISGGMG